jgi:hypothetical protein
MRTHRFEILHRINMLADLTVKRRLLVPDHLDRLERVFGHDIVLATRAESYNVFRNTCVMDCSENMIQSVIGKGEKDDGSKISRGDIVTYPILFAKSNRRSSTPVKVYSQLQYTKTYLSRPRWALNERNLTG